MFSRSLLRVRLSPQTRSLHVSSLALAENNGVFGRFNPWAKKSSEPSTVNTEKNDTPSEAIGNVTFDVDFHDEQDITSWKTTEAIKDVDQIRSSIRNIVSEHIQGLGENDWKEASLVDTDVKFKVIKESIKQIGKEVPNLELNNIATVNDLLAFYERVPDVSQSSIEKFFADNADSLPSNLTFEPPSKSS